VTTGRKREEWVGGGGREGNKKKRMTSRSHAWVVGMKGRYKV
jgi:hypothetical protein